MPEPQACNFIKKETLAQVFSREFSQIPKNTIFTEHLRTAASVLARSNAPTAPRKNFVIKEEVNC